MTEKEEKHTLMYVGIPMLTSGRLMTNHFAGRIASVPLLRFPMITLNLRFVKQDLNGEHRG